MNMQIPPLAAVNDKESAVWDEANDAPTYAARLTTYAQNLTLLPQYADASWWGKLGLQKEAILRQLYSTKASANYSINYATNLLELFCNDLQGETSNADSTAVRQTQSDKIANYADDALAPTPLRTHKLRLQCSQVLLAKVRGSEAAVLPKLTAFAGVKGRIGALPLKEALRLLRMRALAFRRSALRRCIDRASREHLYKWLESSVVDQLMKLPGTPQLDLLERLFDMPALSQLNAEALEWEGLCLLERDGLWEAAGPFAHLRLRFATTRAPLPWIKGTIGHDGHIVQHFDPEGGSAVLKLLPPVAPSVSFSNESVSRV